MENLICPSPCEVTWAHCVPPPQDNVPEAALCQPLSWVPVLAILFSLRGTTANLGNFFKLCLHFL
jgi:hypothetical protein